MPAAEEQHLLQEARKGSRDAYRRLVERHMGRPYNVAYGFVRDRDSARDIVQDALVARVRGAPRISGDAEFSTWPSPDRHESFTQLPPFRHHKGKA